MQQSQQAASVHGRQMADGTTSSMQPTMAGKGTAASTDEEARLVGPRSLPEHADTAASTVSLAGAQPASLSSTVVQVFCDRRRLRPLENPQTLLQDVVAVLAINDQLHILAALLALRRAAVHHAGLLADCL